MEFFTLAVLFYVTDCYRAPAGRSGTAVLFSPAILGEYILLIAAGPLDTCFRTQGCRNIDISF